MTKTVQVMKLKPRKIDLLILALCLLVSYCVDFCPQAAATSERASAESPGAQIRTDFDHSRMLDVNGMLKRRKGKGDDLTGVVGVSFAIYEQQYGGAPLWQEVQNVEVDARGHFSARIGSNTGGGIPPELFTTEKTRWLGVQVLLLGEAERPRWRVMSAPQGLVAGSAGMAPARRKSLGRQ